MLDLIVSLFNSSTVHASFINALQMVGDLVVVDIASSGLKVLRYSILFVL